MGLSLLWPLGLAALAAALLPLLIHLARRQDVRLTEFAALRWLRARPRPRRRLRWDEWPLLWLRLVLLVLLALLLAGLALRADEDSRPRVAVAAGLDPAAARAALPADAQAEWLWLAPGFPPLAQPSPAGGQPNASLLRELDARLPPQAPLRVLVPAQWDGMDAQRPRLSRAVDWRVLPAGVPATPAPAPASAPSLYVYDASQGRSPALGYLRALQIAWHGVDAALPVQPATQPLPGRGEDARRLYVWLSPAPLPPAWQDALRAGAQVLLEPQTPLPVGPAVTPRWRDAQGRLLLETAPLGRGRLWRLGAPLRAETLPGLLEADFPAQLAAQLRAPPVPGRVDSARFAPRDGAGRARWPLPPHPLDGWLAVLIAALFLLERAWASAPRRGGRA